MYPDTNSITYDNPHCVKTLMEFPPDLIVFLRKVERVSALTGAGVSQESGLRTFRDTQSGLWAQYRPEDLATPDAFARDPKLVWDWYAFRREAVKAVRPNPGHYSLTEMEKKSRNLRSSLKMWTACTNWLEPKMSWNCTEISCAYDARSAAGLQKHGVATWILSRAVMNVTDCCAPTLSGLVKPFHGLSWNPQ